MFVAKLDYINFFQAVEMALIPFVMTQMVLSIFIFRAGFEKRNEKVFSSFVQYEMGIILLGLNAWILGMFLAVLTDVPVYIGFVIIPFLVAGMIKHVNKLEQQLKKIANKSDLRKLVRYSFVLGILSSLFYVFSFVLMVAAHYDTAVPIEISVKNYEYRGRYKYRDFIMACRNAYQDSTELELDLMFINSSDRMYYMKAKDSVSFELDGRKITFLIPEFQNATYLEIEPLQFQRITFRKCVSNKELKEFLTAEDEIKIAYSFYAVYDNSFYNTTTFDHIDKFEVKACD